MILDNIQKNLFNVNNNTLNKVYLPTIKKKNTLQLHYDLHKKYKPYNLGRYYCDTSFDKKLQYPLISQFYKSVKIPNLYFKIIKGYAINYNINTPTLDKYLSNKEVFLNSIDVNKKLAKNLVKLACCGNSTLLAEINDDVDINTIQNNDLEMLKEEIYKLSVKVYTKESEKYKEMLKSNNNNKRMELFTVLVKTKEREKLLELVNYFETKLRIKVGRIFYNKIFVENVNFNVDFNIYPDLIIKKFNPDYNLAIGDKNSIINKEAFKVINHMGYNMIYRNDSIYFYNNETHTFSESEILFTQHVTDCIDENYIDKISLIKNAVTLILKSKESENSSIGKLLFVDKVIDVINDNNITAINNKIPFYDSISYEFPKTYNNDIMKQLRDAICCIGQKHTGEYLLKAIAMAMIGNHTRKNVYVLLGLNNTVFADYLKYVFENYVCDLPIKKLEQKETETNYNLKMYWIKEIMNKKITITDNYKNKTTIDPEMVKLLTQHNIPIKKYNTSKTEYVTNKSTLFMFLNNSCVVDAPNVKYINLTYNFDPSLWENLKQIEYREAFFHLIAQTYHNMTDAEKSEDGVIIEPREVSNFKPIIAEECNTIEEIQNKFNKVFKITNNRDNMIPCIDIKSYLENGCLNFNIDLYKKFIDRYISKPIRYNNIRYFPGITYRY